MGKKTKKRDEGDDDQGESGATEEQNASDETDHLEELIRAKIGQAVEGLSEKRAKSRLESCQVGCPILKELFRPILN